MASHVTVEQRRYIIRQELISGKPTIKIVQEYADKWDLSADSILKYIQDCRKEMRAVQAADIDEKRAHRISQLEELYFECLRKNDRATSKTVLAEINKLEGLYKPTQLEVNGDMTLKIEWTKSNDDKTE